MSDTPPENQPPKTAWDGYTLGLNLVVSVLVGLGMGYGLDKWLHTKPLFLIIFLFLGFGAGVRTLWKKLAP